MTNINPWISPRRIPGALVLAALGLWAMPAHAIEKLELFPELEILSLLIVAFSLLIIPVNRLIFRPLLGVLDARVERIEGARKRAAQLEADADAALARYREAVAQVREAAERGRRAQLDGTRAEHSALSAEARAGAEDETERARTEIAVSLREAREGLREDAELLARAAAERVLGRTLS